MPAVCPVHDTLAAQLARVDEERRENEGKLFDKFDDLQKRLSSLEGRLVGYLLAGSILTAGLVFVAQRAFKVG